MMFFTESEKSNNVVLRCQRERLDAACASELREAFAAHLRETSTRYVMDLSGVAFIDSTGLGAIVSCFKQLDGRSRLVLCNLQEAPRELFRLTRLDGVFKIYESVNAATADVV